jgi:hypothetical protein
MDLPKYPKIKRIGHRSNDGILDGGHIIVTEKLDGANFRFAYDPDEDRLVFGSRNVAWTNEKDINSNFEHAVEFVRENVHMDRIREQHEHYGPITYFGEAMHPHTINYDWDNVPSFIGFGIHSEGEFWNITGYRFDWLNLPSTPIIHDGLAENFELPSPDEMIDSEYYDGPAEGIVIRNLDTDQMAKLRSTEFLEAHNGPGPDDNDDYRPSDAKVLAKKFATEARIQKMIHKYEDEGRMIQMPLMEDLWRRVFEDIIEEEFDSIFLGNYVVDTQEFRSEVASKCANELRKYLSRPSNSVLNQARA